MKALILNSGIGKRMGELTRTKNKCMAEIGQDTTILDWQLQLLQKANIKDVVITTGVFAEDLQRYAINKYPGIHFTFCNNPLYESTNYIYSIYLARDLLVDDILLMHGDLVFESSVLLDILAQEGSVMAVDEQLPLPDKDFKAMVANGKIEKVGIEFFENSYAAQPLYKFRQEDWLKWLGQIIIYCENGNRNVYAENALNDISSHIELIPYDVCGRICTEVDNPDDLLRVRESMAAVFAKG